MKKEIVSVPGVEPVRHLSRATRFGDLVFVAGTVGRDLRTGELAGSDVTSQTRQVMENIKMVLEAAGSSLQSVLKATCYLADLQDKKAFDEVYVSYFPTDPPARACFQVGNLGDEIRVEIEMVACTSS